ncbi:hypothetical protein BLD25_04660 [Candidatus Gracilibacteria bacterium GN02-872]|nr:hypothetical protein BLD25_04660 [Candidatus Gracilibacteria bacterium GN02-872]
MNSIKNILKIFDFRFYFDETGRNIGQSPEIKDSQNETVEKSEDQKKIEANKAGMKYLGSYGRNLKVGIDKIAKTEKADDPEFKEFYKKINDKLVSLAKEFNELKQENKDILEGKKTFISKEAEDFGFKIDNEGNISQIN